MVIEEMCISSTIKLPQHMGDFFAIAFFLFVSITSQDLLTHFVFFAAASSLDLFLRN